MSLSRIECLELSLDMRCAAIWELAPAAAEEWPAETGAALLRAAYAKGYCDALQEAEGERGSLCLEHGYSVPRQR